MPEERGTMDSNSTVSGQTRRHDGKVFKELLEIFNKFLAWLIAIIALKFTDTGDALFKHPVMMGLVSISIFYYLAQVLATMLQMHIGNLIPSLVVLMLACAASVSALSLISLAISWLAFFLWLCIFALIAYYNHQELYQWVFCPVRERIKSFMRSETTDNSVRLPENALSHLSKFGSICSSNILNSNSAES